MMRIQRYIRFPHLERQRRIQRYKTIAWYLTFFVFMYSLPFILLQYGGFIYRPIEALTSGMRDFYAFSVDKEMWGNWLSEFTGMTIELLFVYLIFDKITKRQQRKKIEPLVKGVLGDVFDLLKGHTDFNHRQIFAEKDIQKIEKTMNRFSQFLSNEETKLVYDCVDDLNELLVFGDEYRGVKIPETGLSLSRPGKLDLDSVKFQYICKSRAFREKLGQLDALI